MTEREFWQAIVRALWIVMDAICQRYGISLQNAMEKRLGRG